MTNDNAIAIQNALAVLSKANPKNVAQEITRANTAVPTANTRATLDFLTASTQEELKNQELNLREMTQNLFDWHGEKRSTKALLHAFHNAILSEGKYVEAVEITAYIAALAPLLEPDRLARLFNAIHEVKVSYAPARYTVSLYKKIVRLFAQFNEDRREQLAYSLWVESHQGRWWDLTAGDVAHNNEGHEEGLTIDGLIEEFTRKQTIRWTEERHALFSQIPEREDIRDAVATYNDALIKGLQVDPDFSIYAAGLSWLTPLERPESPVGSLLDSLDRLVDLLEDYTFPEKPKKFSELFPDIKLYGDKIRFPFPMAIMATDGHTVQGVRLEVVDNATLLAENRNYMGNCTWGYKGQMEKATYVLYRLHFAGHIYNGSMLLNHNVGNARNPNGWHIGEVNSRHNAGKVPTVVRQVFDNLVHNMPVQAAREVQNLQDTEKALKGFKIQYKL